jgi:2-oxoglutarate dehydrogenase complex dehydrogenase (E1) component-like enzyme
MRDHINSILEDAYKKSKNLEYLAEDWVTPEWEQIKEVDVDKQIASGVDTAHLKDIGKRIAKLPTDSKFHRMIVKIFDARL